MIREFEDLSRGLGFTINLFRGRCSEAPVSAAEVDSFFFLIVKYHLTPLCSAQIVVPELLLVRSRKNPRMPQHTFSVYGDSVVLITHTHIIRIYVELQGRGDPHIHAFITARNHIVDCTSYALNTLLYTDSFADTPPSPIYSEAESSDDEGPPPLVDVDSP